MFETPYRTPSASTDGVEQSNPLNQMTNFITIFIAIVFAVSVGFADSVTFEVTDVEGHKIVGSLEKLSDDEVTLKTASGSQSLRKENLASIKSLTPFGSVGATPQTSEQPPAIIFHVDGRPLPSSRYIPPDTVRKVDANANNADISLLFLTDGSRVFVTEYVARGPDASFTLFGKTTPNSVPLSEIAALIMTGVTAPANTPKFDIEKVLTPEWQTFLRTQTVDDRLIVTRAGSLDAFNGIIREATRERIVFETDGEQMPVPRAKVSGLIYRRTSATQRPELAVVTDVAGNRYVVSELKFENDKLLWQGVANWSGELSPNVCESIVFPQANVIPLTALKPVTVVRKLSFDWNESTNATDEKTPKQLFMQLTSPRFDNAKLADGLASGLLNNSLSGNEVGGTVQLDGVVYDNCLRLSGKTTLTYELPETVVRLRGIAGIDDADRPNSRAKLSIAGDGATLFEQVLSGDELATELRLELNGVRKLVISVDFANGSSCRAVMGAMRLLQ
ncbi:MAG: NPCBM/NEW2 domain-containing protein [Planctomycetaceae bacterium]|jgi:hypothetical protein|nr:NPCBM/NEW2 domain-containing protein [Planctomycetaceae bacterium]